MEMKIRLIEGEDFFSIPENVRTAEYKEKFVLQMEIEIRTRLQLPYYNDVIHLIKWNDKVNFIKYKNLKENQEKLKNSIKHI